MSRRRRHGWLAFTSILAAGLIGLIGLVACTTNAPTVPTAEVDGLMLGGLVTLVVLMLLE